MILFIVRSLGVCMRWYYQLDSHGIFKLCDTAFPELIMVINNNNIQHTHTLTKADVLHEEAEYTNYDVVVY